MVERVAISVPRLPAAFDGITLAVIADVHAGRVRQSVDHLREVVRLANSLEPDVILLLGDIVHRPHQASTYIPLLAGLEAKEAVWASLGNHEHGVVWYSPYVGRWPAPSVDEWRSTHADVGVELLVNEARALERCGSRIWMVGVDDRLSGHDDLEAALGEVGEDEVCIALTHSPDLLDDPDVAELDLVLAGHTHGGQVCLPLLGPLPRLFGKRRRRTAGLIQTSGTTMYITRGAGEGIPIRLRCPRQLPFITLRSEDRRTDSR